MNDNLPIAEPTSATATRLPRAPLSHEHIVVREVVARLPEDRPPRDTIDGIAEWLVGPARHIVSGIASFDGIRLAFARGGAAAASRYAACRHDPPAIPWHDDGVVAGYWQNDAGNDWARDR